MKRTIMLFVVLLAFCATLFATPHPQLTDLEQEREEIASIAKRRWLWTGITTGVSILGFVVMATAPIESNDPVAVGAYIGGAALWLGSGATSVGLSVASIGPSLKFLELNSKVGQLHAEDRKQEAHRDRIQKYGSTAAEAIQNDEIYIGMPRGAVLESWGDPADINRTTTSAGTREQWVYKTEWTDETFAYVYIEDGKVSAIQD